MDDERPEEGWVNADNVQKEMPAESSGQSESEKQIGEIFEVVRSLDDRLRPIGENVACLFSEVQDLIVLTQSYHAGGVDPKKCNAGHLDRLGALVAKIKEYRSSHGQKDEKKATTGEDDKAPPASREGDGGKVPSSTDDEKVAEKKEGGSANDPQEPMAKEAENDEEDPDTEEFRGVASVDLDEAGWTEAENMKNAKTESKQ